MHGCLSSRVIFSILSLCAVSLSVTYCSKDGECLQMRNKKYQLHFIEQEKKLTLGTSKWLSGHIQTIVSWNRAPKSTVFRLLLIWLEKYSFKGSETPLALAMAPKGHFFSSQLPALELWDRFPSTNVRFMIKHQKWRSAFGLCHWHFLGPELGIPVLVQTCSWCSTVRSRETICSVNKNGSLLILS